MKTKNFKVLFALITLLVFVLACGAPSAAEPESADPAPSNEETTQAEAADNGGAADSTEGPQDAPIGAPAIQHTDIPISLPEKQSGQAGDFDSSKVLENKSLIGGDRFTFGRFERPFNANTMDMYYSELDIINTEVFQDDLWIYGRISIKELGATSSTAKYAVELDTNLNGKAEWLIVADKPSSTEWTVAGVRVYQDANQNVGGEMPMLTDNAKPNGDGFETLFFDQGTGENPDTAWVRISPTDANIVEFAILRVAIDSPAKYLINFWAGRNIDPAIFDLNDAYTHEEAGAADAGLQVFYPIKVVAEIDNSCRMAVGFKVTGKEPGLCDVFIPQAEQNTPTGCQATPAEINACNNSPAKAWNEEYCYCQDLLK